MCSYVNVENYMKSRVLLIHVFSSMRKKDFLFQGISRFVSCSGIIILVEYNIMILLNHKCLKGYIFPIDIRQLFL